MVFKVFSGLIFFVLASLLFKYLTGRIFERVKKTIDPKLSFVTEKAFFYSGITLILYVTVRLLDLNLNEVFATAGIITIGIGFAAKTSISNFISGILLLATKTIQVEDLINVGSYTGIVENIDFFSTKLRTFDNLYITIPNEKLITEYVTNYSTFAIRRVAVDLVIAFEDFSADLTEEVRTILDGIPEILKEPAPGIFLDAVKGQGITLGLRVWCEGASVITVKNLVIEKVIAFLNSKNIRIAGERRQAVVR